VEDRREGDRVRVRQPGRRDVRSVRARLRPRPRQADDFRVQPKGQAADVLHDAREGSRRVPETAGVRARWGGPRLSLRRSDAAHPGISVMANRRVALALALAAALASAHAPAAAQVSQAADPQYTEAKRLFDALDYDAALRQLDLAIAGLEARPLQDP